MTYRDRMTADLKRFPLDKKAVRQLQLELETIQAEMTAIKATNYDKMPTGSGTNTQQEKIIDAIARKEEKTANLHATELKVRDMENLLNELSPEDRELIEKTIIQRERNAEEILADKMGLEKRQVFNRKNTAITKLCMIRYGQGYQP